MSGVDLVQWLGEQYDIDAARAQACPGSGEWSADDIAIYGAGLSAEVRAHMAEHDPARVLREIDAKRWEVEMLANSMKPDATTGIPRGVAWSMLRRMAEVYKDRPGWQSYWPGSG